MLRVIFLAAAALLAAGIAAGSALADDYATCNVGSGNDSIAACSRIIQRTPGQADAYIKRGSAYNRKGDYRSAIADFERALGIDPNSVAAYSNRGIAFAGLHEYDRAIQDFGRVLAIDPRSVEAYNNRGKVWLDKGEYDRAIADFNQVLRLNSTYPTAYNNRGEAYMNKGDYTQAIRDYDQALRLNHPSFSQVYANRGQAYEAKGDYARAAAEYDQSLRREPTYDPALRGRERIRSLLVAQAAPTSPPAVRPEQPRPSPPWAARPDQPAPASPTVVAERRVALVIGNSKYDSVPFLPNPRRDAEAVAEALRQAGFQTVTVAGDAGRNAIHEALRKFRDAADNADWGLIYYAGHGIQIGGMNYLIPTDAKLADERDVDWETVSYGELEKAVAGAKALRLIILDACRNNPFSAKMARGKTTRAVSRGLSPPPESEAGMLVVYSAKDGQVAEDGDGANSPFAAALVAQLSIPGREVRRLFDYVRENVMNATGKRQQPFTYGSLPGSKDFFFVAGK